MKVKLLPTLFLLTYQFSFSQTEKSLKGKVSSDNLLMQNVDVINKTTETSTTTNDKGEFIIQAKANDSIYFYAKEYYLQKTKLTSEQIDQNNLVVIMFKKAEELNEVVITTVAPVKWKMDKMVELQQRTKIALDKAASSPKTGIYDGTIENGMDFVQIGKMILGLFGKEKEKKEIVPEIEFATLAKYTCDQKFYLETLKLKPEEIDLFLQYCNADPKSKALIKNHNVLSMMDFLSAKNIEFQKLNGSVK